MRCTDIERQIKDGTMECETLDPFAKVIFEAEISEQSRQFREQIWTFMESIVLCEPQIYEKSKRSDLVSEKAEDTGKQTKTIHRYLKQYWLYGKSKNAYLPNYDKSGGKGKARPANADGAKRGRPRKYSDGVGKNIDEETKLIKIFSYPQRIYL